MSACSEFLFFIFWTWPRPSEFSIFVKSHKETTATTSTHKRNWVAQERWNTFFRQLSLNKIIAHTCKNWYLAQRCTRHLAITRRYWIELIEYNCIIYARRDLFTLKFIVRETRQEHAQQSKAKKKWNKNKNFENKSRSQQCTWRSARVCCCCCKTGIQRHK